MLFLSMTVNVYSQETGQVFQLIIKSDKDVYEVGETIQLSKKITNSGNEQIYVDGGSLQVHYEIQDMMGNKIKEIPFLDKISPMPGEEAFWGLPSGESNLSFTHLWIKDGEWSGFGGGSYKGIALHVLRTAGQSAYPLEKIPGDYKIIMNWLINRDLSQKRAKEFGFKKVLSENIISNIILIKVVGNNISKERSPKN